MRKATKMVVECNNIGRVSEKNAVIHYRHRYFSQIKPGRRLVTPSVLFRR
jgi:hypothetical protein